MATSGETPLPPPELELIDTREIKIDFKQLDDVNVAFDMLWSIHQGAIRATGKTTESELEAIRLEAKRRNDEILLHGDDENKLEATYLVAVIRRKR